MKPWAGGGVMAAPSWSRVDSSLTSSLSMVWKGGHVMAPVPPFSAVYLGSMAVQQAACPFFRPSCPKVRCILSESQLPTDL